MVVVLSSKSSDRSSVEIDDGQEEEAVVIDDQAQTSSAVVLSVRLTNQNYDRAAICVDFCERHGLPTKIAGRWRSD